MTERPQHRVVVAGGGVAGLETVMALRALAGSRVDIKLISPDADFVYRPLSVAEPFGLVSPVRYPLASVAEDFQAELVQDKLESVDPDERRVRLAGGAEVEYDSLVVALGARAHPAWDHVPTFGGSGDAERTAELVRSVERGEIGSVAFVVPRGVTWPLPIYELALMTAASARRAGAKAEIAVFTPEADPLAIFGREASSVVAAALDAAGVQIARGVTIDVTPQNDLVIPSEDTPLRFEYVLAAPLLKGPAVAGLPSDSRGFIPIDGHGRVRDLVDIFAAGDGTDFPVKQGGVAAQQAVAVAETIAQRAGAAVEPRGFRPVLRTRLLTGDGSRFLHGEESGAVEGVSRASDRPLWWPSHKIAAAHLAPYLAEKGVLPEPQSMDAQHGIDEVLVAITEWVEESPYGE
ncbi:MAG: sulfide:quinone oxidoreductase [Gaiellales bacterium]|nr:sulfide:quinone oxidoreductase [Gaiellales bacterium]